VISAENLQSNGLSYFAIDLEKGGSFIRASLGDRIIYAAGCVTIGVVDKLL